MKIKVHCTCATRFEFEVEPVNGRMPVPVNCPGCGADATELANEVIKKQLAAPKPKVAVHVSVHPPAASAAPAAARPAVSVPSAPKPPGPNPAAVVSALGAGPLAPPAGGTNLKFNKPSGAPPAPAPTAAPLGASRVAPPSGGTGLKFNKPAVPEAAAAPAGGPPVAPDIGAPQFCARHGTEPAAETCKVCGKPICLKCMEQFGHVCSAYCREAAVHKKVHVPKYAGQKSVIDKKKSARIKVLAMSATFLVLGVLGALCWYTWFARNPKVVYSMEFPKQVDADGDPIITHDYFRLIGPNQLVSIKNKQIALTDVLEQKQLWSARLQSEQEEAAVKAAIAKNEETRKRATRVRDPETGRMITKMGALDPLEYEGEYAYEGPTVIATTNDVWVAFRTRLARFDRQTGSRKETGIQSNITSVTPSEEMILVVTAREKGAQALTRILLPDGTSETEELPAPVRPGAAARSPLTVQPAPSTSPAALAAARGGTTAARGGTAAAGRAGPATARGARGANVTNTMAATTNTVTRGVRGTNTTVGARGALAQTAPAKASASDELDLLDLFDYERQPFMASGQGVVEFKTKMLEHRTQTRQAMRKAPAQPLLEDKNLKASQGLDVAQEMMNESQREATGGVEIENVSRYEVTLHRRFAKDVSDWTGEVVGEPSLVPLRTMDIVTGFTNIYAIDKSNKKLWEAKLTYPVAYSYYYEGRRLPALETKDAVYFVDKGMVTRFDPATGNVRWRVTTVNASEIQSDGKGGLYIDTTADVPESIELSQEIHIRKKDERVIMKVDAEKGNVVWQSKFPGYQYHVQPEGKFVYSTRIWQTQDPLRFEEGPDTHFTLKLISPSSGDMIWNHVIHKKGFISAEMHDNWIMLHFSDRVEVLKFFSL